VRGRHRVLAPAPAQRRLGSLGLHFGVPAVAIHSHLVILRLRGATWADVGFQKAQPNVLALGCGLLILALGVTFVNNLIWLFLGFEVQAQQFSGIFQQLDQPALFLITGMFLAPLFEETIFRGFLFGGLRQRLGWRNAALLSSAIFGAMHLSFAAFIPTFALGFLFAYLYQRSNSIWPGIILHTLLNSFSLCTLFMVTQYTPGLLNGSMLYINLLGKITQTQ
jgi:hypothetical protein